MLLSAGGSWPLGIVLIYLHSKICGRSYSNGTLLGVVSSVYKR